MRKPHIDVVSKKVIISSKNLSFRVELSLSDGNILEIWKRNSVTQSFCEDVTEQMIKQLLSHYSIEYLWSRAKDWYVKEKGTRYVRCLTILTNQPFDAGGSHGTGD